MSVRRLTSLASGDKCFGVATLMSTMPGLPMFGHGQIEGYTERYGMEFKMPRMTEWPDQHLVERHQREIAPLLKKRYIFAESANFVLYDFWTDHGTVNENVFAYSNRFGEERSVVLYNNSYGSTSGTIHTSAADMDKSTGELRQRSLAQGLALPGEDDAIMAFRDHTRQLEYLRRASELRDSGLFTELRGYQYAVLLNWRDLRSSEQHPWDRLCDALQGQGVPNLDEALKKLRFQALHAALRHVLCNDGIEALQAASENALSGSPKAAAAATGSERCGCRGKDRRERCEQGSGP